MQQFILAILVLTGLYGYSPSSDLSQQQASFKPDLTRLVEHKEWRIVNRSVTLLEDRGSTVVRFDERLIEGIAWIRDFSLSNGTIECDIHGHNVFQKSFVGIAFHGVDDSTFDAIYFRPFNFITEDSARHSHAVQYISHPKYTWSRLRKEFPGKYEQPVSPVPDPDKWFHARVVLQDRTVRVFVNDAEMPCLVVDQLNMRKDGWVGFFLGGGAGGDFKNLAIYPSKDGQGRK